MKTNNTFSTNNTNTNSVFNAGASTGTTLIDNWNLPERVQVAEVGESIEMIYTETARISYTHHHFSTSPEMRVFKIVYSCVDGKWNKSDKIYGKIIPAQGTYYEF